MLMIRKEDFLFSTEKTSESPVLNILADQENFIIKSYVK